MPPQSIDPPHVELVKVGKIEKGPDKAELENWYRELMSIIEMCDEHLNHYGYDPTDALEDLRDEIYSHLR